MRGHVKGAALVQIFFSAAFFSATFFQRDLGAARLRGIGWFSRAAAGFEKASRSKNQPGRDRHSGDAGAPIIGPMLSGAVGVKRLRRGSLSPVAHGQASVSEADACRGNSEGFPSNSLSGAGACKGTSRSWTGWKRANGHSVVVITAPAGVIPTPPIGAARKERAAS